MLEKKSSLGRLLDTLPQTGKLEWIGLRAVRRGSVESVERCRITQEHGLEGDHFAGSTGSKRQVTLIQSEHLPVIAGCLNTKTVEPERLRRNLMVSGINLLALKHRQFIVGDVILEMTGLCHPCSRMEQILGDGGYNAVRGHGGITARVIQGGEIHLDDPVRLYNPAQ